MIIFWICITLIVLYIVLKYVCSAAVTALYAECQLDKQRDPDHEYSLTIRNAIDNIPCYDVTNKVTNKVNSTIPVITKQFLKQSDCLNTRIVPMLYTKNMSTNSWGDQRENTSDIFSMMFASLQFLFDDRYAIAITTGGSSGNSFYYWYNKTETAELLKSYFYCWESFGWDPSKKVLIYYGHPSSGVSFIKYFSLCNINSLIPSFHDGDITEASIIELIATIEQTRPYIIESMPNFMFRVAQYIYHKGIVLTYRPRGLSLSGDFLFQCQYDFIRRVFGPETMVLMSYGAVEFGQIAQQASTDDLYTYRIFRQIAHVENIGDTLAITRYRYTNMPIIRYHIDDKGVVSADRQFIRELVGKNKDVDLMGLNNAIQSVAFPAIINVRISGRDLILIATEDVPDNIRSRLEALTGYTIRVTMCNADMCPTYDNMEGKVLPSLNERTNLRI